MAYRMNTDLEIDFKRSVVHKIKEYPVIWNPKCRLVGLWRTDLSAAWNDVQAAVDFPLRRLKLLWASFRRHYFDILMGKTIQRDNNLPKWKLFHDMSFMYERMKKIISEKMGGMTPPLFKPEPVTPNGAPRVACPCCIPLTGEYVSNSTDLQIGTPHTLVQSWQGPPIEIYDLSDLDDFSQDQTTNSFEEHLSEDSLCESSEIVIVKEPSVVEKNPRQLTQTQATTLEAPLHESSSNRPFQIKFVNEPNTVNQMIETNSLQPLQPESSIVQTGGQAYLLQNQPSGQSLGQVLQPESSIVQIGGQTYLLQSQPSGQSLGQLLQSNQTIIFQEPMSTESISQLIQSNKFQFNQPVFYQEPVPENNQSNVLQQSPSNQLQVGQRNNVKRVRKPKRYVPREVLAVDREKIINAIRPHPIIYTKTAYKKGPLTQTWKEVASEVGLQVETVKNRWKQIKQRYVDEMMRERYSDGQFKSTWGSFQQMEFMRDILKEEVDDIERIRHHIQTLVKEKRSSQTIDLCSDDDDSGASDASENLSTKTRSKKAKKAKCDQSAQSIEQPEENQMPEVTNMDPTSKDLENSDPPDTDTSLTKSYQQAFERSITTIRPLSTNDGNPSDPPVKDAQPKTVKSKDNKKSDVQVIELDLSSDEEDSVISIDDNESIAAESEGGTYAGISSVYVCPSPEYAPISSVYISPSSPPPSVPSTSTATANIPDPNDTICLDDDD